MVVHLRARVRARARSCVCACVRVGCEEGAGFEKRDDVDSRSWLRSLGDARGKKWSCSRVVPRRMCSAVCVGFRVGACRGWRVGEASIGARASCSKSTELRI